MGGFLFFVVTSFVVDQKMWVSRTSLAKNLDPPKYTSNLINNLINNSYIDL